MRDMYLNVDHANLPLPVAIALAAIGAGGGGAGAWLLAARGLAHHPGVQHVAQHVAQQAMYASSQGASAAAEGLSQIGQGPATYLLFGAAAATILGDGRVVLSGFPRYLVCWSVTAVFSGALPLSRSLHASDQQMCG